MKQKKSASFIDYLTVIIKWRGFIIKTFLIITLAAVVISLVIPVQYTATATILPPNPQQEAFFGMMGITSIVGDLGGYSGLGSMLPGATTTSDLFAAILESGTITGKIIRKHDLKKVFKANTMYDTSKLLRGITKIRVSPEGIISVSVTWYDKNLAADIANSYIEELDEFNTETAMTLGKKYRIFIEQRLNEAIDSLAIAEEALKTFQENHGTIILSVEVSRVIEAIAQLKAEIMSRKIKKGLWASSVQADNPYIQSINREINEFEKQLSQIEFGSSKKSTGGAFSIPLSKLPEKSLEYARLVRDIKVQETIYELLTQQYEQAKIMEVKDTPTVQILDRASPPERKSIPRRSHIVILAAFFSAIIGICSSFFLEWFTDFKKQPSEYGKLVDIYTKLKTDFHNVKSKLLSILKRQKTQTK